ncbi:hypothetical protein, partial [Methanosarcina sp. 2.H.T.1A.15]|uniref:hypothetical protein n=1 Tax=Methanosarcina sp. 2.H.T.1A.15 TaxID=1483596 RepID=UPI0012E0425A
MGGDFISRLAQRIYMIRIELAKMFYHSASLTIAVLSARTFLPLRSITIRVISVSYTHLRAHETRGNLVCRL